MFPRPTMLLSPKFLISQQRAQKKKRISLLTYARKKKKIKMKTEFGLPIWKAFSLAIKNGFCIVNSDIQIMACSESPKERCHWGSDGFVVTCILVSRLYQRSLLVLLLEGPPGKSFIIHPNTLSTTSSPSSAYAIFSCTLRESGSLVAGRWSWTML